MKCPKCQAKLLPVDGELFCLQCGTALAMRGEGKNGTPKLEETTDPLLQKAIMDVVRKPVRFKLPVSQAPVVAKTASFNSMRAILAPPRAVLTAAGAGAVAGVVPVPEVPEQHEKPAETHDPPAKKSWLVSWKAPSAAWTAGIAVFGVFLLINGAITSYYSSRVYPGVKVGQINVGGLPLSSLHQKLAGISLGSSLSVEVGATHYVLDAGAAGQMDVERTEREVAAIGHSTPLPLAGAIQSLLSKPVALGRVISDETAKALAAQMATKVNHKPSNAVPMVLGSQAFVISEKSGGEVNEDKLATDIKSAYVSNSVVKLSPDKQTPLVSASAFAPDIAEAQSMLSLSIQLKVRTATYAVSAPQIGSWLAFRGPGKGVVVDGAGVSAYVASLPGTFDRTGTTNAIISAIQNKQNLDYKASTKKRAAPKLASYLAALPLASYSYCVSGDNAADAKELGNKVAAVLGEAPGWPLGGRLKFERVDSGCNFTLKLLAASQMATVSPACAGQATCQLDNQLVVSSDNWAKAPEAWTGDLGAYRGEMVNHEVGHWLGFDRASCLGKPAQPVLAVPTLVLGGCSPNWYAVPYEAQGTKVLAGF